MNTILSKIKNCFKIKGLSDTEATRILDYSMNNFDKDAVFLNHQYIMEIHMISRIDERALNQILLSANEMFHHEDLKFAVWVGHVLRYVMPEFEYLCNYYDFYLQLDQKYAGVMCLYCVISGLNSLTALYKNKNIPYHYLAAALKDIGIWIYKAMNGSITGLINDSWVAFTMKGHLFRIGRLQYEPSSFNFANTSKTGYLSMVEKDIPVLAIHIPEEGKLINTTESISEAVSFFKLYFSDTKYKAFVCNSWLLDPGLIKILEPESNILKFMKLFITLPGNGEPNAIASVFGKSDVELNSFIPKTTLQKNLKEYLLSGNKISDKFGFIHIEN